MRVMKMTNQTKIRVRMEMPRRGLFISLFMVPLDICIYIKYKDQVLTISLPNGSLEFFKQ